MGGIIQVGFVKQTLVIKNSRWIHCKRQSDLSLIGLIHVHQLRLKGRSVVTGIHNQRRKVEPLVLKDIGSLPSHRSDDIRCFSGPELISQHTPRLVELHHLEGQLDIGMGRVELPDYSLLNSHLVRRDSCAQSDEPADFNQATCSRRQRRCWRRRRCPFGGRDISYLTRRQVNRNCSGLGPFSIDPCLGLNLKLTGHKQIIQASRIRNAVFRTIKSLLSLSIVYHMTFPFWMNVHTYPSALGTGRISKSISS